MMRARKSRFVKARYILLLLASTLVVGCDSGRHEDVVDLNKVIEALVATLEDGSKPANPNGQTAQTAQNSEGTAKITAGDGTAEINSTAEIQAIEPEKQDPIKEAEFLKRYAAKLNEIKAMNATVGVAMSPGGEIVGFKDENANMLQDAGESKEFTVTIDPTNRRLVASDNNGYHRPYSYQPGGFFTGYLIGSMLGRQGSFYSGAMSSARPNFNNTPMAPADYHKSAVNSVRSRSPISSNTARARTGSKGFSFGK